MSCIFFHHQITLVRPAPGSWGLRLQGGVDVQKALAIINVADGSPSEMSGLKVVWIGLILLILGITNSDWRHSAANQRARLQHDDPQGGPGRNCWIWRPGRAPGAAMVSTCSNSSRWQNSLLGFRLTASVAGVWKPGVQLVGAPATGPAPQGQTYTQTSLVANPVEEDSHWDVKHNITAKAFTTGETAPGFRSVAAPVSWAERR